MEKQLITRWFLGSNSGDGFCSLYDGYCRGEGDFLRVIKGGPGCGKSSFMRRIGEAAADKGLDVEYIHCSGDPDSLDGVYIPALRLGYADGTSPHIMDPACFGATGDYLNLGAFCDCARSRGAAAQLEGLTAAYKAHYARAYSLLSAAAAAATGPAGAYLAAGDREAAAKRARSMAGRELPRSSKSAGRGRAARRFLGGVSGDSEVVCRGRMHVPSGSSGRPGADRAAHRRRACGLLCALLTAPQSRPPIYKRPNLIPPPAGGGTPCRRA